MQKYQATPAALPDSRIRGHDGGAFGGLHNFCSWSAPSQSGSADVVATAATLRQ
jgi:hypothetical protein